MAKEIKRPEHPGEGLAAATERTQAAAVFTPATDIFETEEAIVVLAEMPGVASDGVDVTLEKGVLSIRGRTGPGEHPGYRQVYAEYGEGDYERTFTVSAEIAQDKIAAAFRDGVLRLTLPKAGPAKARRIAVKAG